MEQRRRIDCRGGHAGSPNHGFDVRTNQKTDPAALGSLFARAAAGKLGDPPAPAAKSEANSVVLADAGDGDVAVAPPSAAAESSPRRAAALTCSAASPD